MAIALPEASDLRGRKILLVDDDPAARGPFARAFRRLGADLTEAADGVAALKAIAAQVPELIITDVTMPRVDGIELTRRLRRNPRTKAVPVIMISGIGSSAAIVDEAREVGCNKVLAKPCDLETLLSAVRESGWASRA